MVPVDLDEIAAEHDPSVRLQGLVDAYDAESRARTGRPPPLAMSGRFDLADDLLASRAADALPAARELVASLDLAAWQRGTGERDWPPRCRAASRCAKATGSAHATCSHRRSRQ